MTPMQQSCRRQISRFHTHIVRRPSLWSRQCPWYACSLRCIFLPLKRRRDGAVSSASWTVRIGHWLAKRAHMVKRVSGIVRSAFFLSSLYLLPPRLVSWASSTPSALYPRGKHMVSLHYGPAYFRFPCNFCTNIIYVQASAANASHVR